MRKVAGAVGLDPDNDLAVFRGEFERIGNVIVKNLLQAARVGIERGERRIDLDSKLDALLGGKGAHDTAHFADENVGLNFARARTPICPLRSWRDPVRR